MAGLAIAGEPDGWLDAAYSVSTLANRLAGELADADTLGAQGLVRTWQGPAASAFGADWATRRTRYEDLIDLVRRAAGVISSYGDALREVQERARSLELYWCAAGLAVSPEGLFVLPEAAALLPAPVRAVLERALDDALTDVGNLGIEVATGVAELTLGFNPVISLLEAFGLGAIGLSVLGPATLSALEHDGFGLARNPVIDDGLATVPYLIGLGGKAVEPVEDVVQVLDNEWDVVHDAQGEGLLGSLEQNAGGIVSTGVAVGLNAVAGDAIAEGIVGLTVAVTGAALAPEVIAGIAIVGTGVLVGLVATGVGDKVRSIVSDHKKAINDAVHDAGDGLYDAGERVGGLISDL